ncbi:unnamed protein product [Urochloa humidicola]
MWAVLLLAYREGRRRRGPPCAWHRGSARPPARAASTRGPLPPSRPHWIPSPRRPRSFVFASMTVPGLKKMDKAAILSDATKYVKELQEKLKDLEAGGSSGKSVETMVLVKRLRWRACEQTYEQIEES